MSTLLQTFFGRKEYRIDPKGRIPLSAEYFSRLGLTENSSIVIARSINDSDNYLEVFSIEQWEEKMKIIDLMADDEDREWLFNNYVGTAIAVELDNQNRIRLPKSLLDYAGVDKDVVFVGAIKTLRIWAKERLDGKEQEQSGNKDRIREKMNAARRLYEERGNK
ncbi:hypothetical protein J5681_02985 [bacterium]|nr:hypothetical protein [bacterium]